MPQPHPPSRRIIELRKHPRIPTPSGALFAFKSLRKPAQGEESAEGEGPLLEISLGGCRLTSDVPLTASDRYNLILQISGDRQPISVDAAVVRWNQGNTYGLKFTTLRPDHETRLQDVLRDIRHHST
jgi:c-di-GMP-binding flagellar brake protein YcgR